MIYPIHSFKCPRTGENDHLKTALPYKGAEDLQHCYSEDVS